MAPCGLLLVLVVVVLGLVSTLVSVSSAIGKDNFREELFFKPLQSGHVYSHFQFTTSWNVSLADDVQLSHYNLFPKSLGQVISKYSVQELHLSLTQGLWRHDKWGYPIVSAPPGAQLWVWFKRTTPNIDQSWQGLVNALSGMFCASLNFIDTTSTTTPRLSFRPAGLAEESYAQTSEYVRHASLPREVVCTENLTPWKKLLPCDSKAGLSTLFHAGNLYSANYHSLAVDLRSVCSDYPSCTESALELSQSLAVVFNPPALRDDKQDWTLRSLFDRPLSNACPMADQSHLYVDISDTNENNSWSLTPDYTTVTNDRGRSYAVYDLKQLTRDYKVNVAMTWTDVMQYSPIKPPHLHAHRFLSGYGHERGGITTQLYNNHPTVDLHVVYTETVPWYIRLHLHTLAVENSVRAIKPVKTVYTPGKDRSNPYLLELVLVLPAQSVTTLSIQFDKAFLKWTEYPPDANIGFHISSAVISALMPSYDNMTSPEQYSATLSSRIHDETSPGGAFLRIYTEPLLIQLPVPDFSMPYNVICLTCTVVAIGFGSLHNLTTRKFVLPKAKSAGFKAKILKLLGRTSPDVGGKDSSAEGKKSEGDGDSSQCDTQTEKS